MTPLSTSVYVTAHDGLKLHVRRYGQATSDAKADALPVVCLAGLARTGDDFEPLAGALAGAADRPRTVIALDYRGRGLSDYDPQPENYNFATELADIVAVLTALEIGPAVFVGTSRGGLLTMLLAAQQPRLIAGAILNDIGPVIEPQGLVRIKSYIGKLPQPRNYDEGAIILRRLFDSQFPKLSGEQWLAFAHRTWRERDGRLLSTYDTRLARTLDGVNLESPLPSLWNEFDALAGVPVMTIRGANSDMLSSETVTAMQARHAGLEALEIPDEGHAPLLSAPDHIGRIARFIASCDKAQQS